MKKIFLFGGKLHGYEKIIINNFINKGYEVTFFDYNSKDKYKKARKIKNPFLNLYNNIFLKKFKGINLKDELEADELNKDLLKIEKNYDYFIKIGPIILQESTLKILKNRFPVLISHHWDTINSNKEKIILSEKRFFNKVSTYSKKDCKKYDLAYLPNFYFKKEDKSIKIENDVFGITSDFTRIDFLEKIAKKLKENDIKYNINLITDKNIESKWINVSKNPWNIEEVLKVYSKSRAVLELVKKEHEGSSTFRTIECIGLNKKLITNNKEIINENFYNKNNILVIKEENIIIPKEFVYSKYEKLPEKIKERYSIENWIKKIIEI